MSFFYLKGKRIVLMDKFFSTVSSLMSLLMRSIIEATLNELMDFIIQYKDGNTYTGDYDLHSDMALPHLVVPFTFYLLPDRDNESTRLSPSIQEATIVLDEIVDAIVDSLNDITRVEYSLFTNLTDPLRYYNMVNQNEDIVAKCKQVFQDVLVSNSYGPNQ